jgi:hypothetical protein
MNHRHIGWTVLLLALGGGPAAAADLTKVDRSIRREPAYRSTPDYCLLVFGPKAEHRVWLVLDGDALYVDRNGNGDLTEKGERVDVPGWEPAKPHPAHAHEKFVKAGDLHVGGFRHTDLVLAQTRHPRTVAPSVKDAAAWQAHVDEVWRWTGDGVTTSVSLALDPACYGWFKSAKGQMIPHCSQAWKGGATPAAAPVLHFGGPLTFHASEQELVRGKKPAKLVFHLGTPGLGRGTFVMAGLELGPDELDLDPVAEIEYPPPAPGKPPLLQRLRVNERC